MRAFVTVRKYLDATEAELARAHLDANGIEARVSEPTGFNPMLNLAAGGVRLEVLSLQVEQAEKLLQEVATTHIDLGDAEDDAEPRKGGQTVRCPRCELEYCFHERVGIPRRFGSALSPLVAVVSLPFMLFGPKRWHCRKCEHVWDDPAEGPKKPTRLAPGEPEPVFRISRAARGRGLMLGAVAGFLAGVALDDQPTALLMLVGALFGYFIGGMLRVDYCSGPTCRAPLPGGRKTCTACKGAVVGRVDSAAEHYAAAADFRREMAACHAR
ncbi:hypothetical protein [Chondromyces apiculatus]|uniref:DUF2007 domain-containing protein n=1 Tax=Chondromyces apiculatus DSM 436 TaxID=1192034 RepID=A0A017T0D3_9BACT|nr:hypothetical protein [Chondromyces apiculatus]EYF02673.1 Hypothetical protein CAP_6563 [Chondromyces apiculatus DSM 436]